MQKGCSNIKVRSLEDVFKGKTLVKFEIEAITPLNEAGEISIEPHRHDYYHILYIKKGNGLHSIDFKTYEIKPNSIFFISPGQVHSLNINKNVEGYALSFNSDFYLLRNDMQKLLAYPFFHSLINMPTVYLSDKDISIQSILDDIHSEYTSNKDLKENMLQALLEILLVQVSRHYNKLNSNDKPVQLISQLRQLETLIDTHYKKYKALDNYAEMMFISPEHLNSLCKKGLNKTVTNLIHERLILESKRLLSYTNDSIAEIADELGFTEKSYFMRFFKKNTRLTPNVFRKQNQQLE